MRFLLITIIVCFSITYLENIPCFSIFSNISMSPYKKEVAYIGNNHANIIRTGMDVKYYRCRWEIDPAERYIKGETTVYYLLSEKADFISLDLRDDLRVDSVIHNNYKQPFIRRNDSLIIQHDEIMEIGKIDSISIYYQGVPANSGYGTFSNSVIFGRPVMWTMSEPFGGRDWWPCRNGLDDKADSIDIFIITPAKYTASSNGLRQSVLITGDRKTTHWKHRYPIASYLVCLAVAEYEEMENYFVTGRDSLLIQTFSYPENRALFKEKTPLLEESMKYFTQFLGAYPFMKEKYGHTQMGRSGGMEHQTNTFISTPEESLMAHELAHQWFGNTITAGSWNHIWLSEGFATLLAGMDMERKYPSTMQESRKKDIDAITSIADGSVYVNDIISVSRIFDSRLTYTKAARILNTLRFQLGDSIFFKGVHHYLSDETLRYGFATTADLQRNMEKASGKDLHSFFSAWVYGQGYPTYKITWSQVGEHYVDIKINQVTSHVSVSFFALPVQLVFMNSTQRKTIVVHNSFNGETFFEKIGFIADTVLIDPDFWLISKNNQSEKIIARGSGKVLVYPNPVSNSLTVYLKNNPAKEASVVLVDDNGKVLLRDKLYFAGFAAYKIFDLTKYPAGTYFMHIKTDKNLKVVKKILKF